MQIFLKIFAALIFSIIENESSLRVFLYKQSEIDTLQVSTFDCRTFESL